METTKSSKLPKTIHVFNMLEAYLECQFHMNNGIKSLNSNDIYKYPIIPFNKTQRKITRKKIIQTLHDNGVAKVYPKFTT